ncbi:hypothetical protein GBA65_07900 [Rubrobacter marinus]|uniref:Uncharacterized protein n=1 Tax=Rubrobacter marinus TaxID=2653852 RepID=A0A6G8PW81_9ACTN|nr:hypothetical protein [Rubrobacter marinus]QIN78460.1 hypothetical protein GBA65_07900 [Rubrobacter marinus]
MGKEVYVAGTVLSILISLALYLTGRREAGIFVGLWAPTILLLGERMDGEDRAPTRRRGFWRGA